MSKSIQKIIKKRSISFPVTRFDRVDGSYDDEDGIYQGGGDDEQEFIKIHVQPIDTSISDGAEGQRSIDAFNGWTWMEIRNKDVVQIGEDLFTVSNLKPWIGVFVVFVLTRSGEAENKVDE